MHRPRRRGRRWIGVTVSLAVVAGGVWIGFQLTDRWSDGRDPGTAEGTSPVQTIPSDEPVGLPAIVDLDSLVDRADIDRDPNSGIEHSDGASEFAFGDGHWVIQRMTSEGTEVARSGVLATVASIGSEPLELRLADAPPRTVAWATSALDHTPGLNRSGDSWVVVDEDAFAASVTSAPVAGGYWRLGPGAEPQLVDESDMRFVFALTAERYAWVYDPVEDVLVLSTTDEDGDWVVAGIAREESGRIVYEEAFPIESTMETNVDEALAFLATDFGIVEARSFDGSTMVVAAPLRGPGIYAMGSSAAARYGLGGWIKDKAKSTAGTIGGAASTVGGVIQSGWQQVDKGAGWVDNKVDAAGSATFGWVPGGTWVWATIKTAVVDPATGQTFIGVAKDVAQGGKVLWEAIRNPGDASWISHWTEKDCGWPGVGPASAFAGHAVTPQNGGRFPDPGFPTSAEQLALHELATLWMPAVRLSQDEQCGEILRIVAKVFPYDPNGFLVNDPELADRVEITYTVFLKEDGGRQDRTLGAISRIGPLGALGMASGAHPGDNEGFTLGLLRTSERNGLCKTGFALYAAQSAAHKDFGPIKRAHDAIYASEWAGFCPPMPQVTTSAPSVDTDYHVWISENKHGIYFHQDVCEAEVGGLEECESGRSPLALNGWVELYVTGYPYKTGDCTSSEPQNCRSQCAFAAWPPHDLNDPNHSYNLSGSNRSFACTARGEAEHQNPEEFNILATGRPIAAPMTDYMVGYSLGFRFWWDPVRVPDLSGMTYSEAVSFLESWGLSAGGVELVPAATPADEGTVHGQSPSPQEWRRHGDPVDLRIGELALVEVPDLGNLLLADASERAEAKGFSIKVTETLNVDPIDEGRVFDQIPAAYTDAPQGTVISVTIGVATSPPPTDDTSDPGSLPTSDIVLRHNGIGGLGAWCSPSTCPNGVLRFGTPAGVVLDVLGSAVSSEFPSFDWSDLYVTDWLPPSEFPYGVCTNGDARALEFGPLVFIEIDGSSEYASGAHFYTWYYFDTGWDPFDLTNEVGIGIDDDVHALESLGYDVQYDDVWDSYWVDFKRPNASNSRLTGWTTGDGMSDWVTGLRGGPGCGE